MKIFSFENERDFLKALDGVDKNLVDTLYTPYPVRPDGVFRNFPAAVVAFVLAGALAAAGLLYWMLYDYPIDVGGKEIYDAAFVFPVIFELSILSGAMGAFLLFLYCARLPKYHGKDFELPIEAASENFLMALKNCDAKLEEFLISSGGKDIK